MVQFPLWQRLLVLGVLLLSLVTAFPNLFSREDLASLPGFLPSRQLSLGLDLRGGSHLLLQVDTDAVVAERTEAILDALRASLRKEKVGFDDLSARPPRISFRVKEGAQRAKAEEVAQQVARQNSGGGGIAIGFGDSAEITVDVAESGEIGLVLPDGMIREWRRAALTQSIEIVRRRVDETGTREPTIQRQGEDRIVVQLPGVDDPERIKRLLGQTAKLSFRFLDETLPNQPVPTQIGSAQAGHLWMPTDERTASGEPAGFYSVSRRVMVGGDSLVDSQPFNRQGQWVVTFRFDTVGARRFAEATRQGVGRRFAIVLDEKVVSAPVIREPILGGSGEISGSFTSESANDLALVLRAGALPAPLTVIEERTIGPGLGADSIAAGVLACVIGLTLVVVYMVLFYGLFGVFSIIALAFNIIMIIAVMTVLGATLSLPGIAGIVLTMGMAVDASVLIFERIKEELRLGKSPIAAIDAGFGRAFGTILDSNLTTLIATGLLFFFGSGPIKGFGTTLSVGIITSMFTAIMVTRMTVIIWMRAQRKVVIPL